MPTRERCPGKSPQSSVIWRRHLARGPEVINEPDRMALLAIARSAVTAYVNGEPPPPAHTSGDLNRPAGAFVTIENHGELRGCIGHLDANRPLATVVAECAV